MRNVPLALHTLQKDPEFEALFPPEKEDLMYPLHSHILPPKDKQYIPSINNSFRRKVERECFVLTLDKYNPKIHAKLDQPFGKDNLSQCFHAEPCLRHVLLPLWKSGFLCHDQKSWAQLCVAYRPMATLRRLIKSMVMSTLTNSRASTNQVGRTKQS